MEERSVITFKNCTKQFGNKTVLQNLSFSVKEEGTFISILGKSGCGKTTLLRLLAGLETLNSGEIVIDGKVVNKDEKNIVPPHQRNIGFIFQDLALFPHFTVFENIAFGLKLNKKNSYNNIVEEALKQFDIEMLKDNYPNQLSGGQQQLVALARSLVLNPKILLMDEPLANLDVKLKKKIRKLLKDISVERNINVFLITHDHKEAMELSDKILLINEGGVAFFGSPNEMIHTTNTFVKEFIEV